MIMDCKLSFRPIQAYDLDKICQLSQNEEELFFMFSKADYPLSIEQLEAVVANHSD